MMYVSSELAAELEECVQYIAVQPVSRDFVVKICAHIEGPVLVKKCNRRLDDVIDDMSMTLLMLSICV